MQAYSASQRKANVWKAEQDVKDFSPDVEHFVDGLRFDVVDGMSVNMPLMSFSGLALDLRADRHF